MGRSAVRVIARTRPTDNFAKSTIQLQDDQKSINLHTAKRGGSDVINNSSEDHAFKLDLILRDASQETVYQTAAADLVKSVMQGYNGTVMAYGQTGAGKTYTMMGGSDYRTRGIVPRTIKAIFEEIQNHPDKTFEVRVTYIEVYMERIKDLLDPTATEDYAVLEDTKGNITVRGVKHHPCVQEAEALAYLFEGNTNRATAEHSLNASSSRSHCMFTIHLSSRSRVESESACIVSKLHCIDLAGSERLSKTESVGKIAKEAQFINKSLTYLEQVVMALGNANRTHVPFRQSKLTNLLKDSLGGNSKTTMIANLWPEDRHLEETMSTLKFATRMMKVQTDASVNMVIDPATQIKQLQRQIVDLKAELQMQNQLMGKSHITYEGEIGEDERFEMEKTVKGYIGGTITEVPVRSLREVKEYFHVFKGFVDQRDAEVRATAVSLPPQPPAVADSKALNSARGTQQQQQANNNGAGAVDESSGYTIGVAAPSKNLRDVLHSPQKGGAPEGGGDFADDLSVARSHHGGTTIAESVAGGGGGRGVGDATSMPEKNLAFSDFKQCDGVKYVNIIKQAQTELVAKKKRAMDLGGHINSIKSQIDSLGVQLEQRRLDRQARGEEEVVDDEEFQLVREAKDKKIEYRRYHDELQTVRTERDHLAKAVEQGKQQLLTEFERWYSEVFGSSAASNNKVSSLRAVKGNGMVRNVDEDDQLDEGERFEVLELSRVMNDDPDSVAFYSAKKITQTRQTTRKAGQFQQTRASPSRKR